MGKRFILPKSVGFYPYLIQEKGLWITASLKFIWVLEILTKDKFSFLIRYVYIFCNLKKVNIPFTISPRLFLALGLIRSMIKTKQV